MRKALVAVLLISPRVARADDAPPSDAPPPPPPEPMPAPEPAPVPEPAPAPAPPEPDLATICKQTRKNLEERAAQLSDPQERGRLLATLPDCSHPEQSMRSVTGATESETGNYSAAGLAFGVSLELAPLVLGADSGSSAIYSPITRILVGYHSGRQTLGLTLDLERLSQSLEVPGQPTVDVATTTLMIGPAVRITAARSETGETEALLVADVGYRLFDVSSSQSMGPPPDTGHVIVAHLGVGLQHWLSPHFALAATMGARIDDFSPPGNGSSAVGAVLTGSIDLMGVF